MGDVATAHHAIRDVDAPRMKGLPRRLVLGVVRAGVGEDEMQIAFGREQPLQKFGVIQFVERGIAIAAFLRRPVEQHRHALQNLA
jgi:hypothetical protein